MGIPLRIRISDASRDAEVPSRENEQISSLFCVEFHTGRNKQMWSNDPADCRNELV
jgi:hypothetical protein